MHLLHQVKCCKAPLTELEGHPHPTHTHTHIHTNTNTTHTHTQTQHTHTQTQHTLCNCVCCVCVCEEGDYNRQFTVITNDDIIGRNFGTKSTLAHTELQQQKFPRPSILRHNLSYLPHVFARQRQHEAATTNRALDDGGWQQQLVSSERQEPLLKQRCLQVLGAARPRAMKTEKALQHRH